MTVPEVTLSGHPRERGRVHGESCRELIAEAIERWFDALSARTDPQQFILDVYHAGFRNAAEAHTPELLAEVEGIAEGADQNVETMFAWQLIDECWWYLDERTDSLQPHEACSSLAIHSGGRGIVAQTQDLYRHFDGSQVLLRYIERDGLEILAPSAAGLLAYNGVNSAGLAVCITTLSELAHSTHGLSSGFVVPTLLRFVTVDDALAWLERTPMASGNSWTLGTRERSVVVEASADGVVVLDDGDVALHTNHALVQDPTWNYLRFSSSTDRLEQLRSTVRADSSVEEIAAMYAIGPICQSRASDRPHLSVGTTIIELEDSQRCHFGAGPLDTEELHTYTMSGKAGGPPPTHTMSGQAGGPPPPKGMIT